MLTRDNRDSAIAIGLPWRMRLPVPDGSFALADRQHLVLWYRGIAVPTVAPAVALVFPELHGAESRFFDLAGADNAFSELCGADNRFPDLFGWDA